MMGRRIVKKVQRSRKKGHVQKQSIVPTSGSHPLMELQRSVGSQAVQRLINSSYIQTKLQVSSPEDKEESEADLTAEGVMRSAEGAGGSSTAANKSSSGGQTHEPQSSQARQSLEKELEGSTSASPLPNDVRGFMEP